MIGIVFCHESGVFQFQSIDRCCTEFHELFDPVADTGNCAVVNIIVIQIIINRSDHFRAEMLSGCHEIRKFTMIVTALGTMKNSERQRMPDSSWHTHIPSASAVRLHDPTTIGTGGRFETCNYMNSVLDFFKKM